MDPAFNPDSCTREEMASEHAQERRYRFQPNIKIQLVTTSDGKKLGGIRLSMFRPAKHTSHMRWSQNPGCNKHLYCLKHGLEIQHWPEAEHVLCHRQRCMVVGYNEVEKLEKSLALCQRELN